MPDLMPSDIAEAVRTVLLAAPHGSNDRTAYLTAYQILDRLPELLRTRLIQERSLGGRGGGETYTAPKVVSRAAESIPGIIIDFIDAEGLTVHVEGVTLEPGGDVCGIYRVEP